ncbi:ABC transporter substrate-binding protein [Gordonia malaquae]|uniref:ABC transporter substrate-binding protein n=1 Tax=Gordonia malaquae TaxID=410332 RepID=UPI003019960A
MQDNAGNDLKQTIEAEPKRVVVIGQNLAELMIAFGLQDKVVGVGYLDGADSYYRDGLAELPRLSEQVPSAESVMALNPDLILSMSFAMTEENLGTAEIWNSRGIPVLMADNYTIGRDLTSYFDDIKRIGTAFGISGKTDEYIANERLALADISTIAARSKNKPRVLLVASGGSNKLTYNYYSPSLSLVDEMVETAGGKYIEVTDDSYAEMSAESIIKAAPDVIVMTQFQKAGSESEKATLLADARLRHVPAIAAGKIFLLDYATSIRGTPHLGELTRALATFLHAGLVFS